MRRGVALLLAVASCTPTAPSALERHPGVARVFVSRLVAAPCAEASDESVAALVCRSLPDNAGALYVVPQQGSFFDPNLIRGRGINHGTPYAQPPLAFSFANHVLISPSITESA